MFQKKIFVSFVPFVVFVAELKPWLVSVLLGPLSSL